MPGAWVPGAWCLGPGCLVRGAGVGWGHAQSQGRYRYRYNHRQGGGEDAIGNRIEGERTQLEIGKWKLANWKDVP